MCKEEMMDDLEEFYEAAGFADFHDSVLKDMNEEKIAKLHDDAYKPISVGED